MKPLTRGLAPGPSRGERRRNLEDALRDVFPEEDHAALIEMLLLAAEKEKIRNNELEMPVPVKEDLLMLLERKRGHPLRDLQDHCLGGQGVNVQTR